MSTETNTEVTAAPRRIIGLHDVAQLIHYPEHWDVDQFTNVAAAIYHSITHGIICPQCKPPTVGYEEGVRIATRVEETMTGFAQDPTRDNAIVLVQEIVMAARTAPQPEPAEEVEDGHGEG